jgi:hypothetical protein
MDQCRRGNGYNADAINHQDVSAFQDCAGLRFRPWERRAIFAMDRTRLAWLNKRDAGPGEVPAKDAPVLRHGMIGEMFG